MDGRNQKRIRIHLEDQAVQERILQSIQRSRGDLAVTIGRASELSGLSISQLRDWEKAGILRQQRLQLIGQMILISELLRSFTIVLVFHRFSSLSFYGTPLQYSL